MNKTLHTSLFILLSLPILTWSMMNTDLTTTVKIASDGLSSADGNGNTKNITISDDGRYMAFESSSSNLVTTDTNGLNDIFVYDDQTGTTTLVSVSTAGVQANAKNSDPVISGNGRYVSFVSLASNLVAGDTNWCSDVFVHDLQTSTTTRVSVGASVAQANDCSDTPSISNDGRYVGFRSAATNLIGSSDTNGDLDFFVRDTTSNTTSRVSISDTEVEGDDDVVDGKISGNGSYFVFTSEATNMVTGDTNACMDVFLRDISGGTTELISEDSSSNIGNRASHSVDVSSNGQYVVFASRASNLITGDTNGYQDIFLRDRTADTIERVNLKSGTSQITFKSKFPVVSDNGRYVLFVTNSSDLDSGDTNKVQDVFVRDRESLLTAAVSSSSIGDIGNKKSDMAALSADSSAFGFASWASNLITGDNNGKIDVFYRDNQLEGQVVNVDALSALTEESGSQNAFTFERFGDTTNALTVYYTVNGGTATSGTDYTAPSGSIVIPALASTATLSITVTDDTLVEANETLVVNLSTHANYTVGGLDSATNSITNVDQFAVKITATDNQAYEDGLDNGTLKVERSVAGGTFGDLVVNISKSGTATAGVDYVSLPSSVLIPDGLSYVDVGVSGIEDSIEEDNESVIVDLSSGTGYTIGTPSQATVTVVDDDTMTVTVQTTDSIADESNTSDTAVFRIDRSTSISQATIIYYSLKGTSQNGSDYQTLSGSATIASGQTYVDVTVTPISDSNDEEVESVIIELLPGTDYTLGDQTEATVIIKEDSTLPVVSIVATDAIATEDGTNTATFTVSRTGSTTQALNVNLNLGGLAINGVDYQTISSSITISSGQSQTTITITGSEDSIVEPEESVIVAIESNSNYIIDVVESRAQAMIFDNELPTVTVETLNVASHESGKQNGVIKIQRSGDLSLALTVQFSTSGSAVNGTDYQSIGSSVQIAAGESEVLLDITATLDTSIEGTESMRLALSSHASYTVGSKSSTNIKIIDNPYKLFGDILTTTPNDDILSPSISDDGRYVSFSSKATNLVAGDTNAMSDIFVVDTVSKTISRIMGSNGEQGNGHSIDPMISANGEYIVFTTHANNFYAFDNNGYSDIILVARSTGAITYVSKGYTLYASGGHSLRPYITSDASYISFESSATNLVIGDTNNVKDIFLYNKSQNRVQRITANTNTKGSQESSVSDDGNIIAFSSFEKLDGDTSHNLDIFYIDLNGSGSSVRVTKRLANKIDFYSSSRPQVSADASTIVFQSKSANLVENDINDNVDVFVYNISLASTRLVSQNNEKIVGNKASLKPMVNKSGNEVFFVSGARNFSPDFNCTTTVFVSDYEKKNIQPIDLSQSNKCGESVADVFVSQNSRFNIIEIIGDSYRNAVINSNPL